MDIGQMGYIVDGTELETDDEGYLLSPDYREEVVKAIAQTEGIALTNAHWRIVGYLRDQYREHGSTPNFRTLVKDAAEILPGADSKLLYDLFPGGPAKQGVRIAGLPKPFGKGGY